MHFTPGLLYKWDAVADQSPAPTPPATAAAPRRRWPWWQRILAGLGGLLLLLAVFYQPLIVLAVKLLAPGLAAKQGLKLNDFKLGGTIFTSLRVENLQVSPTRPGPIEKANVGLLDLHYSPWTLIRQGLNSNFIESVTLHDAEVVYDPSKSPPSPPKKKEPFSLPPLPLPGRLSLRHVTFLMRPDSPEGARATGQAAAASSVVPAPVAPVISGAATAVNAQGLLVKDANLELDPDRVGELKIAELRIPGISDLTDISGRTSYRSRDLQLTDLRLAPDLFFRHLTIDGSKLPQQLLTVALDADLFKGRATATINTQGIGKPPRAQVQLEVNGIALASVRDFLQLSAPLEGTLSNFSVRFDGNTDQPKTWTGRVDGGLDQLNFGGTATDHIALKATLRDGTVQLENVGVTAGENQVALAAKIFLADKMADLPKSDGRGTLDITVPDFTKLPVKLPQLVTGSFKANGDFGLKNGVLTTSFKGHAQAVTVPAQRLAVDSLDFAQDTSKVLPADATAPPTAPGAPPPPHVPFQDKLQTHSEIDVSGVRYADYAVDSAKVVLSSNHSAANLERVEILRGKNSVNLNGTYQIPDDFADAARQPVDVHLNVDVPDLNGFALDPKNPPLPLTGRLAAKGDVASRGGVYNGAFNLQARDVQARGATVQSADVQVGIANNVATVQTGKIVFDPQNTITLDGSAHLQPPYQSSGNLAVNLTDLAKFNPVLAANGVKDPVAGRLKVAGKADYQAPSQPDAKDGRLDGTFNVTGGDFLYQGLKVASVDVAGKADGEKISVSHANLSVDPRTSVTFSGGSDLKAPRAFQGNAAVDVPDLGVFAPLLQAAGSKDKVAGSIHLTGQVHGHLATAPDANDQQIDGSLNLTARDVAAKGLKLQGADVRVDVADNQAVIKTGSVRVDDKTGLNFGGTANLGTPRAFDLNLTGDVPDLAVFSPLLQSGATKEKVAGSIHLAGHAKGQLATKPDGSDQQIDGGLDLTAKDLQAKGAKLAAVTAQIVAANDLATLKTLQVKVDDKNTVNVTGHAGLKPPYDYQGNLDVALQNLAAFESFLSPPQVQQQQVKNAKAARIEAAAKATSPPVHEVNGPKAPEPGKRRTLVTKTDTSAGPVAVAVQGAPDQPGTAAYVDPSGTATPSGSTPAKLGGSLEVHWQAQGNFAKPEEGGAKYSGGGTVAAHKAEYNTLGPLEADVQGHYAQQIIDFPVLFVGTNGLEFRSVFTLKDALARLDKISLKQGPVELLAGYVQIPFDLNGLSAPGGPVPDVEKIDVNVASKPLALETLLRSVDKNAKTTSPLRGNVQLDLNAKGSLSKIVADLKLGARGVHSTDLPTLKPVDADVGIFLKDNRLSLDTSVRQPQINPLTIKGYLPLNLADLAEKKAVDPNTPVVLAINLPRTSLGFLAGATKAIRFIEGTAAADVRVGGTFGQPTFAGSTELNIPAVRADNITVPAVRDFVARLTFTNTDLRIDRFSGEIGGGKLNLGGGAHFVKLSEPTLNISATANNVLAFRDDNLTARVNADLKLTGPLATASLTGYVGIAKSRYLKDIDILPIGSPGKPAPAPPAEADSSAPASIGFYSPPVSNWKLNVDIRTDDPISIRGNLANGALVGDLHLRGTGAKPLLDGNVNVQNLTATLPFSALTIADGNINFTPDQPLNPVLNLNGTSTIRNYLVTVFITGRAHDPKITFSSDPPLAQEQIVSLLATGATTDELTGNSTALAGKATLLVAQDLYRRAFPKKTSAREEPKSTLADKVSLNVGDTDPNTGKQQVGATFKITPDLQFIANLGLEGDLQGRVKYLIRFR